MNDTVKDVAAQVRSKNAGPFWLTIDIFMADVAGYERVSRSKVTDKSIVGNIYGVDPQFVRIFLLPDLLAIKVSLPRPATQGSIHDRDTHSGQQFVPLLGIPV